MKLLPLVVLSLFLGNACKKAPEEAETKTEPPVSVEANVAKEVAMAEVATAEEAKPKLSSATITRPFFYSVQGPDGQSGHLLGTMHLGIDAKKELPAIVWEAAASAHSLTIETDVADVSLAKGLMLPAGQNLKDVLGQETWALLVEKLGEPMANMLLPMKPAGAAAAIVMKSVPMTMPMDLVFLIKAKAADQEIHYLEEPAFQLAMLEKVMTVDTIREMLVNPDASDMTKMLITYRTGDDAALLKEMHDTTALGEDGEEKLEAILYERNANWIPKLEKLFASKGAFVAVGAAHLVGPRSVVDLLTAKGYVITRLPE